ncbi:hypothetical protein MMC26_000890 [Xylographa opegraphella]|nr:hypothetical protein [Xylographa opegraphella]
MTSVAVNDEAEAQIPVISADALLTKCHELLGELEKFQAFLLQEKKEHTVQLRQFRNSVVSELKSLEKLAQADPAAERTIHTLRSSNLPFYSAVWTAAKSCEGLVLFNKRFFWDTSVGRPLDGGLKPRRKRSALVDIVAKDGEVWIKISTITESRLLFEKAKAGWEELDSDSDTEGEQQDGKRVVAEGADPVLIGTEDYSSGDEDDDRVELLKIAEDLNRAAKKVYIRYRHPQILFILPKIDEGHNSAVDAILAEIRATGAKVQCASGRFTSGTVTNGAAVDHDTEASTALTATFSRLLIDPLIHLTPTLNVDCTILLALVSDLSHSTLDPLPTLHRAIRRQIDLEANEKLLPTSLYPAMAGRDLLCTLLAAKRMREIVEQIGTPSERLRTELLLGEGEAGIGKTPTELRARFAETSEYTVPEHWRLPIRVQDGAYDILTLPAVAERVQDELTEINRSVFLYGWTKGWTTVSSNRTVAKLIEGVVESEGEEGDVGPMVWLCATARSLVGKEKRRH